MSGGDKIINRINADCDERIRAIEAEADKKYAEITAEAQVLAQQVGEDIAKKAQAKVRQINAASKSRAELELRNALLKKRREEIDITYSQVLEHMLSLPDKAYFDLIYALAKKLSGKSGTVLLSEKDLQRLPSDFLQKLEQSGIKAELCDTPAKIRGGFILKCGDIEENMNFAAILADKRDLIEDLINRELFAE